MRRRTVLTGLLMGTLGFGSAMCRRGSTSVTSTLAQWSDNNPAASSQLGFSTPGKSPLVFNATESARPGEVIGLQGMNYGASPEVWLARLDGGGTSPKPTVKLKVLNKGQQYVSALIPLTQSLGLYAIWVKNGMQLSQPVFINRARATWLEFDQVAPNSKFRLWGRNLVLPGATPQVRLVPVGSGASLPAKATGDTYSLTVTAPSKLTLGVKYKVYVNNGYGGIAGETLAEETVLIRKGGTDPWQLGVPWAADFSFQKNVYNVKTDRRLANRANGDGKTNDREVIQAAIAKAKADGGGVVYLPAGTYRLDWSSGWGLKLPSKVVLQGAGMDKTTLQWGSATAKGWAIGFSNAQVSGLVDLRLQNASSGKGLQHGGVSSTGRNSKLFIQRVHFDTSTANCLVWKDNQNLLVANSRFDQTGKAEISELTNSDYVQVRGNTYNFYDGRMEFGAGGAGHHIVVEGNQFWRDAAGQEVGNGKEGGGVEFTAVSCIAVLGNSFEIINGSLKYENDGETILSQNCNPKPQAMGTVTAASASTLEDSSGKFQSIPANHIVAIVKGAGAGQWRRITSNTTNTLIIDRAWDALPTQGSKYVVTAWADHGGTTRAVIKDNVLKNNRRGIWLYCGGADVVIVGNQLINSEGILVRSSHYTYGRYNLAWNILVADNLVKNTNGRRPAYIGTLLAQVAKKDQQSNQVTGQNLHGSGILGVEFRRNTVEAFVPNNNSGQGGIPGEGYWSLVAWRGTKLQTASPDQETAGIIGTIFEANTAINTQNAYHLGTGTYQTIIRKTKTRNVGNLVNDAKFTSASHASVDTVIDKS